ncbi:hypothetical protein TW84_21520 [Vibrio neptunius]|uniref:DUF4011 domain-containing anti-phage protein Hhe n=1 Tax=Vibrio neptunius TaxID=170651 RepID=UPI0005FA8023|nr:DUF4011 domain-containing anti-phage protein Hhe [Vibrio neptunius]KJY85581.1 hypothetical protein TW84_21520 [Vibrio neptunius]
MSNEYNKYLIDQLEELVEKHKYNDVILKKIDAALASRRVRKRNTDLRVRIKAIRTAAKNNVHQASKSPENQSTKSEPMRNTNAPIVYPDNFLVSAFEGMRQRLLDTSGGRSRLLNLDQNGRSFVRIVDELPDQLMKLLMSEKAMHVAPVPEPTSTQLVEHGFLRWDDEHEKFIELKKQPDAKQWAGILGIHNSFELPRDSEYVDDNRHTDLEIQSLLFEAELTRCLKKLATDARTAIDETGNNILFLCLGFLEWVEQDEGGRKRLAPLYMLPVNITKHFQNGLAVYRLRYTGEDVIPNLVLREKLQQEFGLTLPEITEPDSEDKLLTPEQYFQEVSALLARKSNDKTVRLWQVRRFGTLATLSLGKLLMYKDLDPRKWPEGEGNILQHEVFRRFFQDEARQVDFRDEAKSYVLDEIENVHQNFPMIEDADSSQMSALIDVMKGKNLVIEGPPGTGKSQTITNILAAAMAQGKSVLFVAEKQAALEVVKRRMDKAGLGDFCLDLHSDGAKKRLVLDDFNQRIANSPSFKYSTAEYERQVESYERAREKLQSYVQMINAEWKHTRLTIHEILMAATRYSSECSNLQFQDVVPDDLTGDTFNRAILDEKIEQLTQFYDYLKRVSQQLDDSDNWGSHPWYGATNKALSGVEPEDVVRQLQKWNSSLINWLNKFIDQCNSFDLNPDYHLMKAEGFVSSWADIPAPKGNELFTAIEQITPESFEELDSYLALYQSIAEDYYHLRKHFVKDVIENLDRVEDIELAMRGLAELGVDRTLGFSELARTLSSLQVAIDTCAKIDLARSEMAPHLPQAVQQLLGCSRQGLNELDTFVRLSCELPPANLSLRNELWDSEELAYELGSLEQRVQALSDEKRTLSESLDTEALPSIELLKRYAEAYRSKGLFSWLSPTWREAKKAVSGFKKSGSNSSQYIAVLLERAATWSEESNTFLNDTKFRSLLQEHFQGAETDIEKIRSMVEWYQKVRAEYGIGFGRRVTLAQALFSLPSEFIRGINTLNSDGLRQQIDSFSQALRRLALVYPKMTVFAAEDIDFSSDSKPLENAKIEIEKKLFSCQRFLVDANISQELLWDGITSAKLLDSRVKSFLNQGLDKKYFGNAALLSVPVSGHVSPELSRITATMDFVEELYGRCSSRDIISLVKQCSNIESIDELRQIGSVLEDLMRRAQYDESEFFEQVGGNRDQWFEYSGFELEHVIERNEKAINSVDWLDGWIKYLFAKARMEKGGYSRLNEYLSQSSCSLEQAQNALKFATYQMLAREIYKERPELTQMSGHEQAAIQQQFAKYDEELKILQRKRVAALASERHIPSGTRGAKVASYTEDALLDHEIKKKTRHISIRNLVTRAGSTLVGYKPCFMMSPMAVAKYIPPGSITFDIVVMDEASQVKPQDALSCFARGKQIVVVGDSKQLPPTSFFEKTVLNDAEDHQEDVGVIDDAESILDAVSDHFQKRQLKWHYRSRHESLIAFSNHRFYDSSLVVFPSPWGQSDEFGIKFNHVQEGQFLNSVNHGESHAVVAAIREHLLSKSSESLGVVAMNSKQRDYIEADLESLIGKDRFLREEYELNQRSDDPLFIKNLENVQGDERDVIFISFTYGPQEKGAANIPQRFGPINSASGWRRLNVLFTRAKKRIQIYSSMTADQIVLNESSSLGVTSLKGYLKYAQHGQLIGHDGVQQKEPDSDFEISVMDALTRKGFECVPQVGVSGFFIDIAVRDPGMPGRYLMGIECDGATYHSSKSTRDRDRVRQGVLEGLGWNIRRIWSTDWFKHPTAELKPIIEELKRLSTPIQQQTSTESISEVKEKTTEELSHKAAKTLEEALTRYKLVIEKKYPNSEPHEKLLRPDMIERLIMDRPMTHEEFTLRVPDYLRQNTSTKEAADYLDDVLEIITDYESIESFS